MKHIKDIFPHLNTITNQNNEWKFKLIRNWQELIGNLSLKVSIYQIYNTSIVLGVSDSSWMHELYLLSDLLKKKINDFIDKPRITSIRFKLVVEKKSIVQLKQDTVSLSCKPITLSNKEKKALAKIKDPELIDALTRLLEKCHQSS